LSRAVAKPPRAQLAQVHDAALAALESSSWRGAVRRRLLRWYDRHARDLPWRRTRDPYHVWVSEIMLQQTVVAAVVPYFQRFLVQFPSIAALAAADEQDVLRLWEGLGYYRRARQLHRAAQVLRDEHQAVFPHDAATVRGLPGIGRYTAGAILSIAFDEPQPILEANTVRLLARLLAFAGDTRAAAGQELLWSAAERLLPRRGAGKFNQALMELGSQVCTPRNPRCNACPLATLCPTRRWDLTESIPAARPRPAMENVREAAVVVRRGARVLLVQRNADERWAGLWDFPRFAYAPIAGQAAESTLANQVAQQTGYRVSIGRLLTTIAHSVTRFRITLDCFAAECIDRAERPPSNRTLRWVRPDELGEIPLSTSARKLARLVSRRTKQPGRVRPRRTTPKAP